MISDEIRQQAQMMFLQEAGRKNVIDFLNQNGVQGDDAEKEATAAFLAIKDQRQTAIEARAEAEAEEQKGSPVSIALGFLLMIGGVIATLTTDSIWYGAILVGAFMAGSGLIKRFTR